MQRKFTDATLVAHHGASYVAWRAKVRYRIYVQEPATDNDWTSPLTPEDTVQAGTEHDDVEAVGPKGTPRN